MKNIININIKIELSYFCSNFVSLSLNRSVIAFIPYFFFFQVGRYWSKEERKRQLERARERKQRQQELMLQQQQQQQMQPNNDLLICEHTEDKVSKKPLNIVELSHKKMARKKTPLDDFTTVQEMLVHGNRVGAGGPGTGGKLMGLLSVTTV